METNMKMTIAYINSALTSLHYAIREHNQLNAQVAMSDINRHALDLPGTQVATLARQALAQAQEGKESLALLTIREARSAI